MRIVMCHGCFDILHVGHVRLLQAARAMGDQLVVSLLSDRYVSLYKGATRPVNSIDARVEVMKALRCVGRVVVVDAPAVEAVKKTIMEVCPDIYVKGSEYDGKLPEHEYCNEMGIDVRFVPMSQGFSTTRVLEKVK